MLYPMTLNLSNFLYNDLENPVILVEIWQSHPFPLSTINRTICCGLQFKEMLLLNGNVGWWWHKPWLLLSIIKRKKSELHFTMQWLNSSLLFFKLANWWGKDENEDATLCTMECFGRLCAREMTLWWWTDGLYVFYLNSPLVTRRRTTLEPG